MKEKSKIISTKRTYLIKSGEVEIEIEAQKPLEGEDIEAILEKDDLLNMPLKEILNSGRILNWKKIEVPKKAKRKGKILYGYKPEKKKKEIEVKPKIKRGMPAEFSPKERIVIMSNMGEILTRPGYQRYIEEKCKIKMSSFMAHADIEQARNEGVIEETGQKVVNPVTQHKIPSYRIINKLPIGEELEDRLKSKEEKLMKSSIFRKQ